MIHPLLGLDHLFAMVTIGLWAAQQGGRTRRAVPAASLPVRWFWAACWPGQALHCRMSVLVLRLPIATRRQWTVEAGMAIAAGFALSTLGLHGMGIAGSLIGRCGVQAAGAGIAVAGLGLIFTI